MPGLSTLWSAQSIAIIGASTRPGAPGRLPLEFLLRYGYSGRIVPVNPHAVEVCGLPAYPTLAAAGPVDLVLIMVGADAAIEAVDECARLGVPVAIVGASGFAEAGDVGAQAALLQRRGRTRILGPNCIGAVNFHTGLIASFSPLFGGENTVLQPGGIALVSQSGALGFGAVSLAQERGIGLGWAVTTGNEADVTALEVLTELAREPECTGLLGYVETLADGQALRRLAAQGKPTALLVAGRSVAGRRAAESHTGALAGDDRVTDAALRQFGIIRVNDIDELLDVGAGFGTKRRTPARREFPRIAVVTTSGGSGILAADALAEHGLN
ncbi:MAG: CoA-binding protein, partial [Longispora sp.]|nr:CoA-binding protein [Longispora sp. (in: high G+C Gram-positive bacteria)]